ncbi:MAG: SDR family oxidoreductase [Pyrinomonadaceae bacterium]|nr:SDR family oxidoreductase [Pyrinomonadaceae bacterium]
MNSKTSLLLLGAGIGAAFTLKKIVQSQRTIDLSGKVVLITGGSRGLGLVLAREFAKLKAKIAICARDENGLERAKFDLLEHGANAFTFPCDVTDKVQVSNMIAAVHKKFGRIDVLINNAGIIQVTPMENATEADFEEAFKTHFWACFHTINEVLPEMKTRKSGRIVNVSSIGGKVAFPHLLPYATSKFALVGYSEGLRAELLKDNIYVTTVCPGLMRTGSPRNAYFKGNQKAEYAWFKMSDSLPFITISAENAARQIIDATRRGDAELIISLPAQLGAIVHGIFPALTADALGIVNQFLPAPTDDTNRSKGKLHESPLTQNVLTTLTDEAAAKNNQY